MKAIDLGPWVHFMDCLPPKLPLPSAHRCLWSKDPPWACPWLEKPLESSCCFLPILRCCHDQTLATLFLSITFLVWPLGHPAPPSTLPAWPSSLPSLLSPLLLLTHHRSCLPPTCLDSTHEPTIIASFPSQPWSDLYLCHYHHDTSPLPLLPHHWFSITNPSPIATLGSSSKGNGAWEWTPIRLWQCW